MASPPDTPAPAVLKIVFHVPRGSREAFERTLREMNEAAENSPGRLGVDVLKPMTGSVGPDEWTVILRYRTEADLTAWRASRTARTTRARLDAMTVGAPQVERVDGLEAWFSLPDRRDAAPPPKWKMAIVSIMAIYPLIMLVQPLIGPFVRGFPRWLTILIEMTLMSPIMTWILLPLLMRLMKTWLYPAALPAAAAPPHPI